MIDNPLLRGSLGNPFAMKIFWDASAVHWKIPPAKNRSARVLKKIKKRTKPEPAIYKMGGHFIAHPSFKAALDRELAKPQLPTIKMPLPPIYDHRSIFHVSTT